MILINCCFFKHVKCFDTWEQFIESDIIKQRVSYRTGIPEEYLKIYHNGHQISSKQKIPNGSSVSITLSLPGGKGGFGSMLRAIGAQIEKTTNREACRDLSGRRLRDINEEQRLKRWISKQAEREKETAQRRKEKLERLRLGPKHDFHDTEYDKQRSELPERIDDALSQGLQKTTESSGSGEKRKSSEPSVCLKKKCIWLGMDATSDQELSDSENKLSECSPDEDCSQISTQDYSVISNTQEISMTENTNEGMLPMKTRVTENEQSASSYISDEVLNNGNITYVEKKCDVGCSTSINSDKMKFSLLDLLPPPRAEKMENKVNIELDILNFNNPQELEELGLEQLKSSLIALGLKCGGTIQERAQRLWSVRGLKHEEFPLSLLAKKPKVKKA